MTSLFGKVLTAKRNNFVDVCTYTSPFFGFRVSYTFHSEIIELRSLIIDAVFIIYTLNDLVKSHTGYDAYAML